MLFSPRNVTVPSGVFTFWTVDSGFEQFNPVLELEVEETLKGTPSDVRWLELEGGTLDGVTLHVSDMPSMQSGERAVFFLDGGPTAHKPHLRGQGVLKLDGQNVVHGSSLRLDEVRRLANEVKGEAR